MVMIIQEGMVALVGVGAGPWGLELPGKEMTAGMEAKAELLAPAAAVAQRLLVAPLLAVLRLALAAQV